MLHDVKQQRHVSGTRIYCGDPQTHVLFLRALNIYNPATETPKVINTTPLDEF
jgi:hypothetical protein